MKNSLEKSIISLYLDLFLKNNSDTYENISIQQKPLLIIELIRESYHDMRNKLLHLNQTEEILKKTQKDLFDQTQLNKEIIAINELLKKKYNELKSSKNELKTEYQEIEETNYFLSSKLIQQNNKLQELQDNNLQLLKELSQVRYELNSFQLKLEKSKTIKNIFGKHSTIIGYVEEEEISAVNPMCKS